MIKEKRDLVKEISDTFTGVTEHLAKKRPEDKWIYEGRAKYWQRVLRAREKGEKIAWASFCCIPELFWAMDIVPVMAESSFGIVSGLPRQVAEYLDLAEQHVPEHICAANKSMIGAALSGDIALPDVMVHASQPCDSGVIVYPSLGQYLNIPTFCVDTPYWRDEATYEYIADEIRRMVSFLEETTKRKLNFEKLQQAVDYSNQAHAYLLKINDLRKNVPCPLSSRFLIHTSGAFMNLAGTPELVDFCRAEYELGQKIVESGRGYLAQEKWRLAWIYIPIFHDIHIFDWLETQHQAIITMDMMTNYVNQPIPDISTPDKIFRGLAEKLANVPMGRESRGPMEYYTEAVTSVCRDYKCNAAVFSGHMACKHGWAIAKLIKDMVQDELGIPTMVFDLDCFDPRISSSESIKAKLEDFFSMISA